MNVTPEETMRRVLEDAHRAWVADMKVGDWVKVVRKADYNEAGWHWTWPPKMDQAIGRTFKVKGIHPSSIVLEVAGENMRFPYFVLEKISGPKFMPFEKVLVWDDEFDRWLPMLYVFEFEDGQHLCGGCVWTHCIPFEGNEHLTGTSSCCPANIEANRE